LHVAQSRAQGFVGQRVQFVAGQYVRKRQAQFAGDRLCGARMVAGDHHYPDACRMALCYRIDHIRTQRILQAEQADE